MAPDQIERTFTYQSTAPGQTERYEALRSKAKELALLINELCPESREKSLAVTNVQQTVMWANAAIALSAPPQAEVPTVPAPTPKTLDPDSLADLAGAAGKI